MTRSPTGGRPVAAAFDLDGTLVESTAASSRQAWRQFFHDHGVDLDEETLTAAVVGRRGEDVIAEFASHFPDPDVDALLATIWDYEERHAQPARAVAGAAAYVRRVHDAGAPLALVTSAPLGHARERLAHLQLTDLFTVLVTAEDVTRGKPDPQGYALACERLGVDPSRAVGFEDAPAGIVAMRAAGLRCVGVASGHTAEELKSAGAELAVVDLTELSWPPFSDGEDDG